MLTPGNGRNADDDDDDDEEIVMDEAGLLVGPAGVVTVCCYVEFRGITPNALYLKQVAK